MHSSRTKFVECVDKRKKVCYHDCTMQLKKKNPFLSFADRRPKAGLLSDLWLGGAFGYIVINGPLLYTLRRLCPPGGFVLSANSLDSAIYDGKSTCCDNFVDEASPRWYIRAKQKPMHGFADPSYTGGLAAEWFLIWQSSRPPSAWADGGVILEKISCIFVHCEIELLTRPPVYDKFRPEWDQIMETLVFGPPKAGSRPAGIQK